MPCCCLVVSVKKDILSHLTVSLFIGWHITLLIHCWHWFIVEYITFLLIFHASVCTCMCACLLGQLCGSFRKYLNLHCGSLEICQLVFQETKLIMFRRMGCSKYVWDLKPGACDFTGICHMALGLLQLYIRLFWQGGVIGPTPKPQPGGGQGQFFVGSLPATNPAWLKVPRTGIPAAIAALISITTRRWQYPGWRREEGLGWSKIISMRGVWMFLWVALWLIYMVVKHYSSTVLYFIGTGSDGSLCVTELEAVLQCVQSDTSDKLSSVTCRRVQRLQPLQTGSSKNRVLIESDKKYLLVLNFGDLIVTKLILPVCIIIWWNTSVTGVKEVIIEFLISWF